MSKPNRTALTLSLLTEVGRLTLQHKFRPLNDGDYACFAGASDEARIAFGGEDLAAILCQHHGEPILPCGGKDAVAVIVDGLRVELHACTIEGEPLAMSLDLASAI